MRTMETTNELETIFQELHKVGETDTVFNHSGYEVRLNDDWVPSPPDVWRSWTGLRKLWGIEFHGDIYTYGENTATPWKGFRECNCSVCQKHVSPQFKYN